MTRRRRHRCSLLRASDGTEFRAQVSPDIDQRTVDLIAEMLKVAYSSLAQMTTEERKQAYKEMPEVKDVEGVEGVEGKYFFDPKEPAK